MSRSYKKNPYIKDNHRSCGKGKQIASQRLRSIPAESEESEILINSPSAFKKINQDSYDIHDYISFETEDAARAWYREMACGDRYSYYTEKLLKDFPTEDEFIQNHWAKFFKRK